MTELKGNGYVTLLFNIPPNVIATHNCDMFCICWDYPSFYYWRKYSWEKLSELLINDRAKCRTVLRTLIGTSSTQQFLFGKKENDI